MWYILYLFLIELLASINESKEFVSYNKCLLYSMLLLHSFNKKKIPLVNDLGIIHLYRTYTGLLKVCALYRWVKWHWYWYLCFLLRPKMAKLSEKTCVDLIYHVLCKRTNVQWSNVVEKRCSSLSFLI